MGNVRDLGWDTLLLGNEKRLICDCLLLDGSLVCCLVHSLVFDGVADMGWQPTSPGANLGGL